MTELEYIYTYICSALILLVSSTFLLIRIYFVKVDLRVNLTLLEFVFVSNLIINCGFLLVVFEFALSS